VALYGAAQSTDTASPAPALAIAITSPTANFSTGATAVSLAVAANWLVALVNLAPGINHIPVTVTNGPGKSASQTISITRNTGAAPRSQPSGNAETTPPTLQILLPSQAMLPTSASTITPSGSASDSVGVVAVKWTNTFGASGAAQGTASWQIANIRRLVGTNRLRSKPTRPGIPDGG
jgi:hypothetical protein